MSNQHRRSRDLPQQSAAADPPSQAGGPPPGEDERQGAESGARREGGDAGYRYEQMGDALAHARRTRPGANEGDDGGQPAPAPVGAPPTDAEQVLMASLGIQFDGRAYSFAGFRYHRLADAVLYARQADGPT